MKKALLFFTISCAMLGKITTAEAALLGLNYNISTSQNEIRRIDPSTGTSSVISSFSFDSGWWFPSTFAVDNQSNSAFAVSTNNTLYRIDLITGSYAKSTLSQPIQILGIGTDSSLISISKNNSTSKNELQRINPDTGVVSVISSFAFDSEGWYPSTFAVDRQNNSAFAISGNKTLYRFDLITGDYATSSLNQSIQILGIGTDSSLISISKNNSTSKNELQKIDPKTGTVSVISSFAFDSEGWYPSTFAVDAQSHSAFAVSSSNTLYQFDLTTGNYTTSLLDQEMQVLRVTDTIISTPVPEPNIILLFSIGIAGLTVFRIRKRNQTVE